MLLSVVLEYLLRGHGSKHVRSRSRSHRPPWFAPVLPLVHTLVSASALLMQRIAQYDAIGAVAVADGRQDGVLLPGILTASPLTQQLVDEEVRRIVDEAEQDVIELLNRERGPPSARSPAPPGPAIRTRDETRVSTGATCKRGRQSSCRRQSVRSRERRSS